MSYCNPSKPKCLRPSTNVLKLLLFHFIIYTLQSLFILYCLIWGQEFCIVQYCLFHCKTKPCTWLMGISTTTMETICFFKNIYIKIKLIFIYNIICTYQNIYPEILYLSVYSKINEITLWKEITTFLCSVKHYSQEPKPGFINEWWIQSHDVCLSICTWIFFSCNKPSHVLYLNKT